MEPLNNMPTSSPQDPSSVLCDGSSCTAIVPVHIPTTICSLPSTFPIGLVQVQNIIASVHLCVSLDLRNLTISVRNAEYNPRKVNAVVIRLRNPRCTGLVFQSGRMMLTGATGDVEAKLGAKKIAKLVKLVVEGRRGIAHGHLGEEEEELQDYGIAEKETAGNDDCFEKLGEGRLMNESANFTGKKEGVEGGGGEMKEGLEVEGSIILEELVDTDGRGGKSSVPRVGGGEAKGIVRFKGFKIENLIASADCGVPVRLEDLAKEHKEFCCYEPELFAGLVYRYNPCNSKVSAVLLIFVSGKIIITGCKTQDDAETVFDGIYPVIMQYQN